MTDAKRERDKFTSNDAGKRWGAWMGGLGMILMILGLIAGLIR